MDEKPLLIHQDREGLIQRLKRLENEIQDIKKRNWSTRRTKNE
jgi:hypothetical protein